MQMKLFHGLYLDETAEKGRGVFTRVDLPPMKVVEISSVLVMDDQARKHLDQTALHDYIFEWDDVLGQCCVAWGYISMYNHSYNANCEYEMDFEQRTMKITTVRVINAGEELTINYNGDWNNEKPLWFDAL